LGKETVENAELLGSAPIQAEIASFGGIAMKSNLAAAALIGLLTGVLVPTLLSQRAVNAQQADKRQAWDYKVVWVAARDIERRTDLDSVLDEQRYNQVATELLKVVEKRQGELTDQFKHLGADGWEYAGPVEQQPRIPTKNTIAAHGAFLLFKRLRQ
jgi:hypothetical protein